MHTLALAGESEASCASQPTPEAYNPPGFFSGVLHGFLILFSFIGSLFTDVRIYDYKEEILKFKTKLDPKQVTLFRGRNNHELQELTISKDVKAKFMKELNEMNINRYTMYLNEDALIKSLADDWALENA